MASNTGTERKRKNTGVVIGALVVAALLGGMAIWTSSQTNMGAQDQGLLDPSDQPPEVAPSLQSSEEENKVAKEDQFSRPQSKNFSKETSGREIFYGGWTQGSKTYHSVGVYRLRTSPDVEMVAVECGSIAIDMTVPDPIDCRLILEDGTEAFGTGDSPACLPTGPEKEGFRHILVRIEVMDEYSDESLRGLFFWGEDASKKGC